jgi:AcrR family transcriptional regulator
LSFSTASVGSANKRLLYVYFGNKEQLFDAILERHVDDLNDAVPIDAQDLGAYAGAVFDHLLQNLQAVRLIAWRDFERESPTKAEESAYATAIDLLALTQGMITSWLGATVGLKAAAGKDPMSPRRLKQHRQALVDAVRRITEPHEATDAAGCGYCARSAAALPSGGGSSSRPGDRLGSLAAAAQSTTAFAGSLGSTATGTSAPGAASQAA